MEKYEDLKMEIITFEETDVITGSPDDWTGEELPVGS